MANLSTDAVIRFEPDGYDLNRPWLLGRQSAGHGFLRAAVKGRGEGPVFCYSPHVESARLFGRMVREFDPSAEPTWLRGEQLGRIGEARGVLYLADPSLTNFARTRMRVGTTRYSLCGVTHTLATHGTQQLIAELLSEAVMPWDALVCTSVAALKTAEVILDAQVEFLRWRFGPDLRLRRPQLPVIPLGVHCDDFEFDADEKAASRQALGIAEDEVAALYVGRLVYTGKAHPFPVFQGLQAAAERSGKKIVFIICGRAPNDQIAEAYLAGAARHAPDVRIISVDSREDAARRGAWAAGDIFVSLADGIQETFGLTPVEAMASGLPVVVSDYNGYRDTVRDGVDGFRITSWAPEPGLGGETYALRQELDTLNYNNFTWLIAAATAMDIRQLADRLTDLVQQPDLRKRLGSAGKARAREVFDWPHVYRQYQALWGELNARRSAAVEGSEELAWAAAAPKAPPSRLDPLHSFGHYPTLQISPATLTALAANVTLETFDDRMKDNLFPGLANLEPVMALMFAELEKGESAVTNLARAANLSPHWATFFVGTLAKMGLVTLRAG